MKSAKLLVAFTLLGLSSAANAQINLPNPADPGGSYESAIRLIATNEMMVDRQIRQWLRRHYPGWDAEPHQFQELGNERYAVVYITSANNPGRRIYFRVQRSQSEQNEDGFPL